MILLVSCKKCGECYRAKFYMFTGETRVLWPTEASRARLWALAGRAPKRCVAVRGGDLTLLWRNADGRRLEV